MTRHIKLIEKGTNEEFRGVITKYAYKWWMTQDPIIEIFKDGKSIGHTCQSELIRLFHTITPIKEEPSLKVTPITTSVKTMDGQTIEVELYEKDLRKVPLKGIANIMDFMDTCKREIVGDNK